MTNHQIVEHLAREFFVSPEQVQNTLEMLDAGLRAPFIGRVRRTATGGLSEGYVRRLGRRREELEDLDRRRGTILRSLEGESGTQPKTDAANLARIRECMDRFELEDLFLPHRRPEPEVQLALDRGLGLLADELVAPLPREQRAPQAAEAEASDEGDDNASDADEASDAASAEPAAHHDEAASASANDTQAGEAGAGEAAPVEVAGDAHAETPSAADGDDGGEHHEAPSAQVKLEGLSQNEEALLHGPIEVTPELARVCAAYVLPDRGLHTDAEALAGAMRILSDRLGRNARLRATIRKLLRKQGVLTVRATVDENRLGRHKPLIKIRQPLRQVQGHRLIAIRQAQKERVVTTAITLDRQVALAKVRSALGNHTKPEFRSILDAVALRTLEHRLLPLIEADVRLELKERADDEALRFLSSHLREVLMISPLGRRAVAGIDISAKGDWTVAFLDDVGTVRGVPARIDVGDKDAAALAVELKAMFELAGEPAPHAFAIGHSKLSRLALPRLRAAMRAAECPIPVMLVNDSGVTSYTSSEAARAELSELAVPQRSAVSLARRLQDPISEILKIDPKHLGLGPEQGLVSKANLRRMLDETVESCASLVGCDLNRAPLSMLAHLPGLDEATAKKLIERRTTRPFESREELRNDGLLSEVQWTNAIGFLRIQGSTEPLDRTSLHPEHYDTARRVLESSGGSVADSLGRPGVTKGLRRVDFDVEDNLWRDLMRELWHPGRDPRPPLHVASFLSHDTDRVTLTQGRVIEGVVSNVASFGAFIDVGLDHDGLVHVSEISDRYVRDARELVGIGQCVRLRIVDGAGQRIALSLKHVPDPERPERPARDDRPRGDRPQRGEGRGGEQRGGDRRSGPGGGRWEREEPRAPVRAATTRRDGLVTGGKGGGRFGSKGGRGGGGGGGGRGGNGGGGGGKRDRW